MGSKWDIEKFTGSNDFGLWKVKMRAILIQQKCVEELNTDGYASFSTSLNKVGLVVCIQDAEFVFKMPKEIML